MFQYFSLLDAEEEKEFFAQIYETYKDEMFYTAYLILRNKLDAEDVVQESFLPLIDYLDTMKKNSPQKNWNFIVTIVKNKAFNYYKKRKRKQEMEVPEEEWEELDLVDEELEIRVIEKEQVQLVMELMGQMDESYRDILLMRYYHGMKVREIADIVNKTPDNIRHISQRAKKKLQGMLEKYGYFGGG